jgi:hypothetical protein
MVNQFQRLRDGDRFFYLNENLNADENNLLQEGNTLAKVIESNTDITNLQSDVFKFTASISGTIQLGRAQSSPRGGGNNYTAGITVNLEDTTGDILATTTTNRRGRYSFNQLSGPATNPINTPGVSATGTYEIVPVWPTDMKEVGSDNITAGGQNVANVNYTVESTNSFASTTNTHTTPRKTNLNPPTTPTIASAIDTTLFSDTHHKGQGVATKTDSFTLDGLADHRFGT